MYFKHTKCLGAKIMLFLQQWLFFGLFFSPCAVCAWFCAIGLLFSVWLPGLPGRAGWAGEPWVVAGNDCLHGSRRAANRLRRVCRMACSVMPSGPFWPPAGAVLQGQTARGGKWLGVSGLRAMAALPANGERFLHLRHPSRQFHRLLMYASSMV